MTGSDEERTGRPGRTSGDAPQRPPGDRSGDRDSGARHGRRPDRADLLGHVVGAVTNRVLGEVDPDVVVDNLDVNALLDRVDVDRLIARADVNALLDRVDVDALLDRVDADRLLDRVDVEALVQRVDVEALAQRAGIPDIVADSTGQLAGSALDLARRQLVAVDLASWRISQRLLGRDPSAMASSPSVLVESADEQAAAPDPSRSRVRARYEVSGFYAGPISRLLAFGGDLAVATLLFTAGTAALGWLLAAVFGVELDPGDEPTLLVVVAGVTWLFVYWWTTTAVIGRTPAMMLAGLRIVARDGTPLRGGVALVRVLALPLSTVGFLGGAWMLVDRERRAVHDLLARSAVVYDWGGRPAELPTPLSHWLARRDQAL